MRKLILGLICAAPWPAILAADSPRAMLILGVRQARATPQRQGFTHTGGGNIDVSQPAPDTIVVTMSGVAVAGAHPCKDSCASLTFDLEQCFEIAIDRPGDFQAKLSLESRVIGLLRSQSKCGSANEGPGRAVVRCGTTELVDLTMPVHAAADGENLSLNDRCGPRTILVSPGSYALHQAWRVSATHPKCLFPCKSASAEFAPEPALDPLWISYWEPFKGAAKKDFGFQVIVRVVAESAPSGGATNP